MNEDDQILASEVVPCAHGVPHTNDLTDYTN